jgi:hypothetical protein
MSLSHAATAALPATPEGTYWKHDVFLTKADGTKTCIKEIEFTVDPAVTV